MYKELLITLFLLLNFSVFSQQKDSTELTQIFYKSGELSSEGQMKDGKPIGYWKSYYRNGNIKTEGDRIGEQLNGPWKFYDQNGKLTLLITYAENKKNGERISFYDNGVPKRKDIYKDDKKEEYSKIYYRSGKLKRQIPFVNNREQGLGLDLTESGRTITLLTYKSGILVKEYFINRYDENELRKGMWMEFYENAVTKVEGTYKKDLRHGYWKYYKPNGNLLRIEKWVNGVLIPEDEITGKIEVKNIRDPNSNKITSTGPFRAGKKDGIHRYFDENGATDSAKIFSLDVLLAEGAYDNQGRKQDLWKYYFHTGELKEKGKYKNDLKTGVWNYYFADGSIEQTGGYTKDKPSGTWKWYYPNKELRLEEDYANGLEDGPSIEYADSGTVIAKGEYIDGLKEGEWYFRVSNIEEIGKYYEGEKEGTWKSKYIDNGKLAFQGEFLNGVKDGKFVYYHDNGAISRREYYKNGVKDGIWEYSDARGVAYLTIEYQNGKEIRYNGEKISYGRRVDRELEAEEQAN